jgi:hypothetical protein
VRPYPEPAGDHAPHARSLPGTENRNRRPPRADASRRRTKLEPSGVARRGRSDLKTADCLTRVTRKGQSCARLLAPRCPYRRTIELATRERPLGRRAGDRVVQEEQCPGLARVCCRQRCSFCLKATGPLRMAALSIALSKTSYSSAVRDPVRMNAARAVVARGLSPDPRKRRTTGMKEGNGRVLRRRSSESRRPCPCVGVP